ncbi:hypothetical protein SUSAZ_05110 [Sulfolobus acidocaldarius SUSAZ]|nr:hypothetical protein SUSAZ_05110 [Sulfolobus acidocaldarius SUSAZ]
MESLDLTTDVEKGTCESGSTYMSLLRFWLEVGGNKEVKVIAWKGRQEGQVDNWVSQMADKGVKIVDKKINNEKVTYIIYLS